MKLSRKLVPAIAMLLVSAVMLSTASFAWFSMNTTVDATGMNVQAKAMGSLIITAKDATLADASTKTGLPAATETQINAVFKTNNVQLYDATHDATQIGNEEGITFKSGLKTLSAAERAKVGALDGKYTGSTFVQVGDTGYAAADYYIDYVVYISSKSDVTAIPTGKNLVATVGTADGTAYAQALAVDFYLGDTPAKNNWLGTTHATTTGNTCTIKAGGDGVNVPEADGTADGCIAVTMRVYIDGAVDTLVQNGKWSDANVSFDVNFAIK